jgi:acyl carrier protein
MGGVAARFAEVASADGLQGYGDGAALAEALAGLAPEERHRRVLKHLAGVLATVLYTSADEIDVTAGLDRLGVDSLMAVELVNGVRADLGVEIPTMALLRGPSLSELTDHLLAAMDLGGGALVSAPIPGPPVTALDAPDPDVEALSEAELDALLEALR